jgi:hypothetical protein
MREFTVKVTGRVEDLFEEEDFHDALYSYSTHMGLGFDIDFEAKENVCDKTLDKVV